MSAPPEKRSRGGEHGGTVRRLRESDLARVEAIASLTFGAHDWIVDAFKNDWFASAPVHIPLCLEVDGVVAALIVVRRANTTVGCVEALRVPAEYRGRGYAHVMLEAACAYAAKELSGVRTLRYTTYDLNTRSRAVCTAAGFALAKAWPYCMVADASVGDDVEFMTFKSMTVREYRSRLGRAAKTTAAALRKTTDAAQVKAALLRAGESVIIQNWKPLDVENVHALLDEDGGHYALMPPQEEHGGFSIGTIRPDGAGLIALFSYYAALPGGAETASDLCTHAAAWLDALVAQGGNSFWYVYPAAMRDDLVSLGLLNAAHMHKEMLHEKQIC